MSEDECNCGEHSTCKVGDEKCTGCGKKCPTNRSKIEGIEGEE